MQLNQLCSAVPTDRTAILPCREDGLSRPRRSGARVKNELNTTRLAAVDDSFDNQADDPCLLLRVEHVPELVELGEGGGDVARIDSRLLKSSQFAVDLSDPLVDSYNRFFELAEPSSDGIPTQGEAHDRARNSAG